MATALALHAGGFALLLRSLMKSASGGPIGSWPTTWLLIGAAWWLILIHAAEIAVWPLFYARRGCMPDFESALYFSGVKYATVDYGDLLLPEPWRILGPLEALTWILMCGPSTGLFAPSW
ncbi:MAG: hypothetical protein HZA52_03480 [Planctomycetes bacterium]|nr:hypothetical protein [Planctomycetota bacterium]